MMCIADINTATFKIINPAFEKNLGYSEKDLLNKPFLEFIHPKDRQKTIDVIENVLKKGEKVVHFVNRYRHKDGNYRWIDWNSHPVPDRGIIFAIARDITDQTKFEQELGESRERYSSLVNNLQTGVFYINNDGEIMEANPALINIVGSPSLEATRQIDIFNYQPLIEFGYTAKLKQCIEEEEIVYGEGEYQSKWGKKVYIYYYFVPIKRNNKTVGVLASIEDISLRKRQEKELKEKNRLLKKQNVEYQHLTDELKKAKDKAVEGDRLKTAFLHNLSHEIRTPMNSIIGFAQLLKDYSNSEDKRTFYADLVTRNAQQLLEIITDIITLSSLETRQEKVNYRKTNINQILATQHSRYAREAKAAGLKLIFNPEYEEEQALFFVDGTKIFKIISNLLSNAIKYTSKGKIEYGYSIKTGFIVFYVSDTGRGIHPDLHEEIFKQFRQVDSKLKDGVYKGTGIGLPICKGLVELMGGKIWLESEKDKGSIFYFKVPYKKSSEIKPLEKSVTDEKISIEEKSISDFNILVVEDEETNYLLLQEILDKMKIRFTHVSRGEDAVIACNKNPEYFDMVLMDIKLPGMDGVTATKHIKEENPSLPVIAQTAYALKNEIVQYSRIFDDYLTKPLMPKDINKVVEKYLVRN